MNLSAKLRLRISALGELSRPLGDARASALARDLATEVANEVARGRDPDRAIDSWIRRIASEIVEKQPREATKPKVMRTPRRLADVLPEIR
ncbi:MAG: hypothetical protein WC807_07535 [Hyphomicrobium sp.]|jgi:hypothetical protein